MSHGDQENNKFSCEIIPLSKSKKRGNSNPKGGRCLKRGRENNKFSWEIIPLRKSRIKGICNPEWRVGDASCGTEKK
jgi:hypothetical protein